MTHDNLNKFNLVVTTDLTWVKKNCYAPLYFFLLTEETLLPNDT